MTEWEKVLRSVAEKAGPSSYLWSQLFLKPEERFYTPFDETEFYKTHPRTPHNKTHKVGNKVEPPPKETKSINKVGNKVESKGEDISEKVVGKVPHVGYPSRPYAVEVAEALSSWTKTGQFPFRVDNLPAFAETVNAAVLRAVYERRPPNTPTATSTPTATAKANAKAKVDPADANTKAKVDPADANTKAKVDPADANANVKVDPADANAKAKVNPTDANAKIDTADAKPNVDLGNGVAKVVGVGVELRGGVGVGVEYAMGFSERDVLTLLGVVCTQGSVDILPPSRQELIDACSVLHHPREKITVAARALSKHCLRCKSGWWGDIKGTDVQKNLASNSALSRILDGATWINMHALPPRGTIVCEIREKDGYGARWELLPPDVHPASITNSGTSVKTTLEKINKQELSKYKLHFRGYLEPPTKDGHANHWVHE